MEVCVLVTVWVVLYTAKGILCITVAVLISPGFRIWTPNHMVELFSTLVHRAVKPE